MSQYASYMCQYATDSLLLTPNAHKTNYSLPKLRDFWRCPSIHPTKSVAALKSNSHLTKPAQN